MQAPDPYIAEFSLPAEATSFEEGPLLICERIQDPGNLGTLIRSALAFNFCGVIFLPGCVDPFHEKLIRSARGGLFQLPYKQMDLSSLQHLLKETKRTCFIADLEGASPEKLQEKQIALVLSNEGSGPSKEILALGAAISIPISSKMESLNVSIAGSILMYEARKR